MAKKKIESGAAQTVKRHATTGEVTELNLPFTDPQNHEQVGKNYFAEHDQYLLGKIVVADDYTCFPGTLQGQNAAENYCRENKINYEVIDR